MRNKRFFIVLVGALMFGVLAAVSVSRYLSSAQAYTKNLNRVAVAKVAIPLGTKIIPEQIMVVQFPKESTAGWRIREPGKADRTRCDHEHCAARTDHRIELAPEGTAGGSVRGNIPKATRDDREG